MTPRVWRTHRGYAVVLGWLAAMHAELGLDALLGGEQRHSLGTWSYVKDVAPLSVWGWAHLLTGLLVIVGMYRSMTLARVSLAAACGVLAAEGLCFGYGWTATDTSSAVGFIFCSTLAGISLRAVREPEDPRSA